MLDIGVTVTGGDTIFHAMAMTESSGICLAVFHGSSDFAPGAAASPLQDPLHYIEKSLDQ